MNIVQRIVKNTGASLLAQVSTPACSFVLVFLIARFLGVSGLGKFSSALSLFYIFQALSSLGFTHLITREVAQDKSQAAKYLINASLLGSFFSILMVLIMCLVINLITDVVDIVHAVYILSISLVPYTLSCVCQSICRAFEKLEYIAVPLIAGNVFKALLGFFILFRGYGLETLMIVILGSHFLIFLLSLYFVLKCIPKKLYAVDFPFCKWIIRTTPVFALIIIVSSVRWNIDMLILTNMMGEIEVGFYSAAFKLMNISKLGLSCYIMAIQPVIFRLFKSSIDKFTMVCKESIRYLFILMLPIAVGTALLSEKFIVLIFKQDFLPSAIVLSIIVWILIFSGANLIFANALVASNNQKVNLHGNLIAMISNICLNLLLIPKLSFIGAGIASISSSLILLSYQYFFVSRHLFSVNYVHVAKKPFISAALMGTAILLFRDINLVLLISVSALVYVLCLLALKTFSPVDTDLLRKLWKGERDLRL